MIFLDSSFLIAVAKPKDNLHARAKAWALTIHEPLAVTEYVLCETVNALSLPPDRAKAHILIATLRSNPNCRIVSASPSLFDAGLKLHAARNDKEWSLTDAISFHVMAELNITRALAYDHHFEQADFEALLRKDPQS